MANTENKPTKHIVFEGTFDFCEILEDTQIGDYIEIITNNQQGWELHEVILNDGVKTTKLLKNYDDLNL